MIGNLRKIISQCAVLSILLFSFSGCVWLALGAVAGAGGAAYVKGGLEKNFDANVEKVYNASLKTLKEMNILIMSDEKSTHSALIKGEELGFEDKNVRIDIKALTEHTSQIKIRIGLIGDERRSLMILNKIEEKL